jgi:hypothetical protein
MRNAFRLWHHRAQSTPVPPMSHLNRYIPPPLFQLHCKKRLAIFPSPARKSLVCDIPAGDGKITNLFYSVESADRKRGLSDKFGNLHGRLTVALFSYFFHADEYLLYNNRRKMVGSSRPYPFYPARLTGNPGFHPEAGNDITHLTGHSDRKR